MATKRKKTVVRKKPARKGKASKKSFFIILRQWSLPILLLLLIGVSLAAMLYIIFLHTPSKPLF